MRYLISFILAVLFGYFSDVHAAESPRVIDRSEVSVSALK